MMHPTNTRSVVFDVTRSGLSNPMESQPHNSQSTLNNNKKRLLYENFVPLNRFGIWMTFYSNPMWWAMWDVQRTSAPSQRCAPSAGTETNPIGASPLCVIYHMVHRPDVVHGTVSIFYAWEVLIFEQLAFRFKERRLRDTPQKKIMS